MSRLFSLLLLALLGGCHQAYFGTINIGADAPLVESRSVVYDAERGLAVDIYRATDAPANAPLILFFYGGTWRYGQREWYRFAGESLADHGFVVMIPDYRTAPDVTWPAFIEDAARAGRADATARSSRLVAAAEGVRQPARGIKRGDHHPVRPCPAPLKLRPRTLDRVIGC